MCRISSIIEKILIFLYFIIDIDAQRYISFEYDNRFESLTTSRIVVEYTTIIDYIYDLIYYNFVLVFTHSFCDLFLYRVFEISRVKFISIFQINVLFSINLQNFYQYCYCQIKNINLSRKNTFDFFMITISRRTS